MKIYLVLFVSFCFQISLERTTLDLDISKFKVANETDQIMLVIPPYKTAQQAKFYYYIKNEKTNQWDEYIATDCNIGKAGIDKEKEGDKKTPTGIFQFDLYFGIYENPGTTLPYIQVNESLYWDGDNDSRNYNKLVNIDTYTDFDPDKSEHLIDYNPGYEYGINIGFNQKCERYKGSGIFLHCYTNNPYTAGCVAIHKDLLADILRKLSEKCYIIIDLFENMKKYTVDEEPTDQHTEQTDQTNKADYRAFGILAILLNLLL